MTAPNPWLELTREFNDGRVRAAISSGQAVVLHRLALTSKDGDWILREDEESLAHVIGALARHGATYRFGAPLDLRWMAGGWSAHLEFQRDGLRIRTDFVTRPPRLSRARLARLWEQAEQQRPPVVNASDLADLKKTNREKDYAIIGELARLMPGPSEQLRYSRSARDIRRLAAEHPGLAKSLAEERPLLGIASADESALEAALDAERRTLMHTNERRLLRYLRGARAWAEAWPSISRETAGLPLLAAHRILVARAEGVLPFLPPEDEGSD